jgi:mannose-6-phosphate isomerase-like protein (cupin superfamily)
MAAPDYPNVIVGAGYAVGDLAALGEGPGFRKVRRGLGVTAFGVNAVVMPAGYESGFHAHEHQEELYFLHRGALEMEFGDGSVQRLEPGTFARVDPSTMRKLRNVGDEEAVYVCVGGKEGYVGRDAHAPEGEQRVGPAGGSGERS